MREEGCVSMYTVQRDRRGFTLIELIIAIAILAALTMPIMNYFTDSMKRNMENRTKQDASVAAQNILEDFKNTSYSLDDASLVCSAAPDWNVDVAQTAVGGEYTLKKDVTVDDRVFQVKAKIKPISEVERAPSSSSSPVNYQNYVIGTMDTASDVMSSDNGSSLRKAELAFFNRHRTAGKAAGTGLASGISGYEDFADLLNREIIVSSEQDPKNAKNKIIRTTYQYTYNNKLGSTLTGITDGSQPYVYSEEISADSIRAEELKNIYLFYTPPEASNTSSTDTITFKLQGNKNGDADVASDYGSGASVKDVNLFIVAQTTLSPSGDANPISNILPLTYVLKTGTETGSESFGNAIGKVYTNLPVGRIDETAALVSGKTVHSLVHGEAMNRVANITVTVQKESKDYVSVSGAKEQK